MSAHVPFAVIPPKRWQRKARANWQTGNGKQPMIRNGGTLRSISRSLAALVPSCRLLCQEELTILEHQDEVDKRDDRIEIADE